MGSHSMEEMVTSSTGKPRQRRGSIILYIYDEATMQLPDKIHGVTTVAYGQSIVLLAAIIIQSRGFDLHRKFCPHLKLGLFYPTAADSGIK